MLKSALEAECKKNMMNYQTSFAWYVDLTPNGMFSIDNYPVAGKRGLPLCRVHGEQLEQKEVVVYDQNATEQYPPNHCWICED